MFTETISTSLQATLDAQRACAANAALAREADRAARVGLLATHKDHEIVGVPTGPTQAPGKRTYAIHCGTCDQDLFNRLY